MATFKYWINQSGGRRFVLCWSSLVVHSILLWFGRLSDNSYTVIAMGTIGAYLTANTVQKAVTMRTGARKTLTGRG